MNNHQFYFSDGYSNNIYQLLIDVMEEEKQSRKILSEIGVPLVHGISFPRELLNFFQDEEKVMQALRILKLQSFK